VILNACGITNPDGTAILEFCICIGRRLDWTASVPDLQI